MIDINNNEQLVALLRNLAANCNNTLLTGSFTGENILKAAALCNECHLIVNALKEIKDESGK